MGNAFVGVDTWVGVNHSREQSMICLELQLMLINIIIEKIYEANFSFHVK